MIDWHTYKDASGIPSWTINAAADRYGAIVEHDLLQQRSGAPPHTERASSTDCDTVGLYIKSVCLGRPSTSRVYIIRTVVKRKEDRTVLGIVPTLDLNSSICDAIKVLSKG